MTSRDRWLRLTALAGELGELSAARTDETIRHLLEQTCVLIGASDALMSFGLLDRSARPDDPLLGWRGTFNVRIGAHARQDAAILDAWYRHRPNLPLDPGIVTLARTPDTRAFRHAELSSESAAQQHAVTALLDECRIGDRILATRPIADGVRFLFGAYRRAGNPPFDEEERDLVQGLLEALGGSLKRVALGYGILATRPLTPREREVLRHVLEGRAERDCAAELGLAPRSLHHHVTTLYRKFGVTSRAELMALFLGSHAPPTTVRQASDAPRAGADVTIA